MKRLGLMVYRVSAAIGVQAVKQYRDFTDTKGRTIRGCIVSYDATTEMVKFERDNRKTSKVPITIFSETDQTYIRGWPVLKDFSTERMFKISVNRKKSENEEDSSTTHNKKTAVEDTNYEILFENRSPSGFNGLELEYRIYYEQEDGKGCNQGVYCGDTAIKSIVPRSKKTFYTEAVSTYTKELDSGWYYGNSNDGASGRKNIQRGDVHGVWIRLHLTLTSGAKETRELCYPDSLSNSRVWVSSSIRVGMN